MLNLLFMNEYDKKKKFYFYFQKDHTFNCCVLVESLKLISSTVFANRNMNGIDSFGSFSSEIDSTK